MLEQFYQSFLLTLSNIMILSGLLSTRAFHGFSELERLEELIDKAGQIESKAHIVQHYWLVDCIKAKNRLPEDNYCLHQLS